MQLFNKGPSLLEVQNRALIKTAKQRAERIDELERELQIAASQIGQLQRELQPTQERTGKVERDLQTNQEWTGKLERDLQTLQGRTGIERDFQQAANEMERLTLERDFYSKRASELEEQNRKLSESATKYSLWGQKLERELTEAVTKHQRVERELSESATKYSLWGQKLERELTEAITKHQRVERELTEAATRYSLWGQKLERELAKIDPAGAPGRRFDAQEEV